MLFFPQRLGNYEIKYISRRILEAPKVLYEDNFVHTGECNNHLGQANNLIYLRTLSPITFSLTMTRGDIRFMHVQSADCGSTVPSNSAYAKDGVLIGAPIWRSPEAQLRIGWGTPIDIWSFGAVVYSLQHPRFHSGVTDLFLQLITLFYGHNFFLINQS
jgi:hypothetical protein